MDKALFRAYVRELVKEMVNEEVNKILPRLLDESIREIKSLQENNSPAVPAQKLDRSKLAALMGLERIGDTVVARTGPVMPAPPRGVSEDNPAFQAINKDYSVLMKKMGLSK